jgi:hypothetical protein
MDKQTELQQLREFFHGQGFSIRTYVGQDDVKKWWVLEVSFKGTVRGAFIFEYESEVQVEW